MSLITNLFTSEIIKLLEKEFLILEPQLQEAFVNEMSFISNEVVQWINEKLNIKSQS
jgi:hypothetical protein